MRCLAAWALPATLASLSASTLLILGCTRATTAPPPRPPAAGPTSSGEAGPARDGAKAAESCDQGAARSCLDEGRAAIDAEDRALALERFERACALGLGLGCQALAALHDPRMAPQPAASQDGVIPDPAAARAALSRGCALGTATACGALGVATARGQGADPDPEAARAPLERSCELGDALGCRNLGLLLERPAPPHDLAAAAAAMTRACDAGDGPACAQHGHYLHAGRGVPADAARALERYRRACELGFDIACDSAARLALEIEDEAGPWIRGMILEREGPRLVVELQSDKDIPAGTALRLFEWGIRDEVRDWYEVAEVRLHDRDGRRAELRIQARVPGVRTPDFIPLQVRAGVRLQWAPADGP